MTIEESPHDPARRLLRVPAGKIAAVVTHLEMTARPALRPDPPGAWTLRRVETPDLDWFRDLYRRVGEEWLWFSRLQMADADLAAIIQSPLVEVYALVQDGRDEGLLELDFREAGQCELGLLRRHRKTDRQRRRALADEPRAGAGVVAAGRAASGCIPARWIIRPRWRSISARGFVRSGGRSRSRTIRGWTAPCRAMSARHVPIIE